MRPSANYPKWNFNMFARLLAAVVWVAGAAICLPARATEEILSFESQIEVRPDSTLLVSETIRVRAERGQIRRGIYRDFPVRHRKPDNLWQYVDFKLLAVERDGQPETYRTEQVGNYRRIYAGDKDLFLAPGVYTYTFRYRTGRQLRHFKSFDELFWNVTGNSWSFPILRAVVQVKLPAAARISRKAGYTGRQGARGADYRVVSQSPNTITIASTRPFNPGEGMTIAIGWQKGLVAEPGASQIRLHEILDNIGLVVLFIGALVVLAYFVWAWMRVGRDPARGTVIPLFKPPDELSPAAISYIHFRGFKKAGRGATKPFIASLVSLAVKDRLSIVEDGKDVVLERTGVGGNTLSPGEEVLFTRLLGTRTRIAFTKSNGPTLKTARNNFRSAVLREYGGRFFNNNRLYFFVGLALSLATIIAFLVLHQPADLLTASVFIAAIGTAIATFVIVAGANQLRGFVPGIRQLLSTGISIAGVLFVVTRAFLYINFDVGPVGPVGIAVAGAIIGLVILNLVFYYLLRAPTVGGAKTMDAIKGFRLYLKVAEAERMNMAGVPDMSQRIYESYLPYAIGLGVEKPWSQAFSDHLEKAMPQAQTRGYHPHWYRGGNWNSGRLGSSTSSLVSSMTSGMAAAMPAPKGSSGSGGGGFSGGGGGGGGGGGW
jgi:hypothetical protein